MPYFRQFAFILFALLGLVFDGFAAEAGRVVSLRGEVVRTNQVRGIASEPLKAGAILYQGDQLQSGPRSLARILMKDETLFQVGPETTFVLEKFDFKGKDDRQATYQLVTGKLRSLFTQKAKENELMIKTPTASMGIRGTEILSDVYRIGDEVKTDIALIEGRLEVRSALLDGEGNELVTIQPGDIFKASANLRNNELSNKVVERLPTQILRQVTAGEHTFLFDAVAETNPSLKNEAQFDLKVVSHSNQDEKGATFLDVESDAVERRRPASSPEPEEVRPNRREPSSLEDSRTQFETQPERLEGATTSKSTFETRVSREGSGETFETKLDATTTESTRTTSFDTKLDTTTTTTLEPTKVSTFDTKATSDFDGVRETSTFDTKLDTTTTTTLEPTKVSTFDTKVTSEFDGIKETSSFDTKLDTTTTLEPTKITTFDTKATSEFDGIRETSSFDTKLDTTTTLEPTRITTFDTKATSEFDGIRETTSFDTKLDTSTTLEPTRLNTFDTRLDTTTTTTRIEEPIFDSSVKMDTNLSFDSPTLNDTSIKNDTLIQTETTLQQTMIDAQIKDQERTAQETFIKNEDTTRTISSETLSEPIDTVISPTKMDSKDTSTTTFPTKLKLR